jgi:hypothetical protein
VAITVSTLVCALVAQAPVLGASQLPESDEQRDRARTQEVDHASDHAASRAAAPNTERYLIPDQLRSPTHVPGGYSAP